MKNSETPYICRIEREIGVYVCVHRVEFGKNYVQKNCKHDIIGWQTGIVDQS